MRDWGRKKYEAARDPRNWPERVTLDDISENLLDEQEASGAMPEETEVT